jgi:hypothetical protein
MRYSLFNSLVAKLEVKPVPTVRLPLLLLVAATPITKSEPSVGVLGPTVTFCPPPVPLLALACDAGVSSTGLLVAPPVHSSAIMPMSWFPVEVTVTTFEAVVAVFKT